MRRRAARADPDVLREHLLGRRLQGLRPFGVLIVYRKAPIDVEVGVGTRATPALPGQTCGDVRRVREDRRRGPRRRVLSSSIACGGINALALNMLAKDSIGSNTNGS